MSGKLLGCPFCGCDGEIVEGDDGASFYARCTDCGAELGAFEHWQCQEKTGIYDSAEDATEAWNRRAPEAV